MIGWVFPSNGIVDLLLSHCITTFNRCEGLFDYIFNFFDATVQKCRWCVFFENAKTFSLVLNTLNQAELCRAQVIPNYKSLFLHGIFLSMKTEF